MDLWKFSDTCSRIYNLNIAQTHKNSLRICWKVSLNGQYILTFFVQIETLNFSMKFVNMFPISSSLIKLTIMLSNFAVKFSLLVGTYLQGLPSSRLRLSVSYWVKVPLIIIKYKRSKPNSTFMRDSSVPARTLLLLSYSISDSVSTKPHSSFWRFLTYRRWMFTCCALIIMDSKLRLRRLISQASMMILLQKKIWAIPIRLCRPFTFLRRTVTYPTC